MDNIINHVIKLAGVGIIIVSPILAALSWHLEVKRRFRLEAPRWRSSLALLGLTLASASVILMLVCEAINRARGGPEDVDLNVWFARNGFLSVAVALPLSLIGKSRTRWYSFGAGILAISYWFISTWWF
jgi:hypothetical protein